MSLQFLFLPNMCQAAGRRTHRKHHCHYLHNVSTGTNKLAWECFKRYFAIMIISYYFFALGLLKVETDRKQRMINWMCLDFALLSECKETL